MCRLASPRTYPQPGRKSWWWLLPGDNITWFFIVSVLEDSTVQAGLSTPGGKISAFVLRMRRETVLRHCPPLSWLMPGLWYHSETQDAEQSWIRLRGVIHTQGEITYSFRFFFLFSLALIINVCFTISNITHLFLSSTINLTRSKYLPAHRNGALKKKLMI